MVNTGKSNKHNSSKSSKDSSFIEFITNFWKLIASGITVITIVITLIIFFINIDHNAKDALGKINDLQLDVKDLKSDIKIRNDLLTELKSNLLFLNKEMDDNKKLLMDYVNNKNSGK